jgi:hypothetical protein
VRRDIVRLEVRPSEGELAKGAPLQLNLLATSVNGGTDLIPGNMAVWSSSAPAVAEINRQGRLSPRRAGTVTITATYEGAVARASFTVVER